MGFLDWLGNLFSDKDTNPYVKNKDLANCEDDKDRLTETNNALLDDNALYTNQIAELITANEEQEKAINDLTKQLSDAQEAASKYESLEQEYNELKAKYNSNKKEKFIGSMSTATSVIIIVLILFAVGVLMFVGYKLWKRRSVTPVVVVEDIETEYKPESK